jgi:hypothetical protein
MLEFNNVITIEIGMRRGMSTGGKIPFTWDLNIVRLRETMRIIYNQIELQYGITCEYSDAECSINDNVKALMNFRDYNNTF